MEEFEYVPYCKKCTSQNNYRATNEPIVQKPRCYQRNINLMIYLSVNIYGNTLDIISQLCAWGEDIRIEQFLVKAHPADSGMLPPVWRPAMHEIKARRPRRQDYLMMIMTDDGGCAVDDAVCFAAVHHLFYHLSIVFQSTRRNER